MKKIISLLLSILLVLSVVAGCANKTDNNGDETSDSGSSAETTADENDRANTPDSLPELDFDGETVIVLARTSEGFWTNEMDVETEAGDVVEDAIYERNRMVEERLNCDLQFLYKDGGWEVVAQFNKFIEQSVLAADGAFDIIAGYGYMMCFLAMENLLYNLKDVQYIDYDQPWWPSDLCDELTLNSKMHMIAGDCAISSVKGMTCILFNKQLAEDYKFDDFYTLVTDGSWTFEKLKKAATGVYDDVNGNSEADGSDIYSIANTCYDPFLAAFETPVTTKDTDGYPVLNVYNDKIVEIFNELWDLSWNNTASYSPYNVWQGIDVPSFDKNQVLLNFTTLYATETLRDMDVDFGIIPIPKYDEAQEVYHTMVSDSATMIALPVSCTKADTCGAVIEALAAQSYRTVVPAYYKIALNEKYLRDSQSSQMLDIIHDGRQYNIGYVYTAYIGINGSLYRQIFQKNDNITSFYNSNKKTYDKMLEKLIAFYWDE